MLSTLMTTFHTDVWNVNNDNVVMTPLGLTLVVLMITTYY